MDARRGHNLRSRPMREFFQCCYKPACFHVFAEASKTTYVTFCEAGGVPLRYNATGKNTHPPAGVPLPEILFAEAMLRHELVQLARRDAGRFGRFVNATFLVGEDFTKVLPFQRQDTRPADF